MVSTIIAGNKSEPEIGEIPVAFLAKAKGSELTEDDVKQLVAKEVLLFS
jgi:4-coumarate--CoA ligase